MDLQDKQSWCELGELEEGNFLKSQDFHLVNVLPNVAKANDKFTHDMRISFPSDLKTIRTKWRLSQEMFDIDPKYAISLNKKDIVRYQQLYPNIIIVFDIEITDYKEVHWSDLTRITRLITRGLAKEHTYKQRVDDSSGNAKSSYIFDCRWFPILRK